MFEALEIAIFDWINSPSAWIMLEWVSKVILRLFCFIEMLTILGRINSAFISCKIFSALLFMLSVGLSTDL